jgi:hypothetical protein
VVRSRTEAAAELIRLEHEKDRLTQALAAIEPRRQDARERLRQIDERSRLLLGFLDVAETDDAISSGPATHHPRQSNLSKGFKT